MKKLQLRIRVNRSILYNGLAIQKFIRKKLQILKVIKKHLIIFEIKPTALIQDQIHI